MLMPRRAAIVPALPDGAPSKVASRASAGWLAAFEGVLNGNRPVRADDDGHNSFAVALWCGRLEPENARAPFFCRGAHGGRSDACAQFRNRHDIRNWSWNGSGCPGLKVARLTP